MSALVENIYLPVVSRHRLRLAAWRDLAGLFPDVDIRQRIACEFKTPKTPIGDYDEDSYYALHSALHWLDPQDPRLIESSTKDILILGTGCTCAAAAYNTQRGTCDLSSVLGLVLRLTAKASLFYMLDLLRYSVEGARVPEELATAKSRKDWLKTREISAPPNRLLQIYRSIAFRQARQSYLNEVANLSHGREPLQNAQDLFVRRKKMVRSLHDEMLLQVESNLRPLPFFVEYPYAQFIGTADRAQRIRHAQSVLNILCKSLILLPLEELQRESDLPESVQQLIALLRRRAASDGTLLQLSRDLRKTVKTESLSPRLKVFSALVTETGSDLAEQLSTLVAARNRVHHPPYDERGFLDAATTILPSIIGRLRETLSNVELIIPKQVRPSRESTTVLAMKVMGENPAFRSFEFETSLPAGQFIVDELAAYQADDREALIPLNHWFQTKTFSAESVDVGLFDRMEREELKYSFITH